MRREPIIVTVRVKVEMSWLDALKLRLAGPHATESLRKALEGVRIARLKRDSG